MRATNFEDAQPGGPPAIEAPPPEPPEAIPLDTLRVAGEGPRVLGYSRDVSAVRQRYGRRFAFVFVSLLLVGVAAFLGYTWLRAKARLIDSIPGLGPADWTLVLREPVMRDLAGRILQHDYRLDSVGLYARHRDVFRTELVLPLRYQSGSLRMTLRVTNLGTLPGIVPALEARNDIVNYDLDNPAPFAAVALLIGPYFGSGARVLAPGASADFAIAIRTSAQPHPVYIFPLGVQTAMGQPQAAMSQVIRVQPEGSELFEPLPYERWEDVPAEAIQTD